MTANFGTCRGCRFPDVLVDADGVCHDCSWEMDGDPSLRVEDLHLVMPGPEDIAAGGDRP